MAKTLVALLCYLVPAAAPAFTIFQINRYINGFADSDSNVIRLVVQAHDDERPELSCQELGFVVRGHLTHVALVRPDSAREYQRPRSTGARDVELILRRVPENDNQVVIDFNGNAQSEQQAGLLLAVVGLEATMGFGRLFDWMIVTRRGDNGAGELPSFSLLNVLASDPVNELILENLNSQSGAGSRLLPQQINVPGRLSVNGIIRTPDSGHTIAQLKPVAPADYEGWTPNRMLRVIAQPDSPGYSMTPAVDVTDQSLPVPVEPVNYVAVNLE